MLATKKRRNKRKKDDNTFRYAALLSRDLFVKIVR